MNVAELVARLWSMPPTLPVVVRAPEYGRQIPVEVTVVEHQSYVPSGAVAGRGPCCVITADPDCDVNCDVT